MHEIILLTLNARFAHASFGLRYLLANMPDELRPRAALLEFDINRRPLDVLEIVLSHRPRVVGIGVYIWNARQSLELVAALKRVAPDVTIVLGGPEVSHESQQQEICRLADYVITGEADLAFGELCAQFLSGHRPLTKVIPAPLPEFAQLRLPYDLYDQRDIEHRVIYVEASRGCPFKCEFCLSSLDVPVRNVPLDAFLSAMQTLLDRGVRQFKFVDRTFNLNLGISKGILDFFLAHYESGMFLHFEMIPDRLPEALRSVIREFAPGVLQFEVGIQTFNPDVQALISRRQDNDKVEQNLRWLREQTGVHVHADLLVGLPGEDVASFARGFDRLVSLGPQEIQVGLLKRLRGTPIVRHDAEWGMVYSAEAPYEVLRTRLIDFATMQRLRRFARYWDLVANSGNFLRTTARLCEPSPFEGFMRFCDWLYERTGQTHQLSLSNLAALVFEYLARQRRADPHDAARVLWEDYTRCGRSDVPAVLKPFIDVTSVPRSRAAGRLPGRQARHLA